MFRWLLAISAALALGRGDAAAERKAPRAGGVVRVERVTTTVRRHPRVLQVISQSQLRSYGAELSVGTEFVLLDNIGVVGRGTVTSVQPSAGMCQEGIYDIEFEVDGWNRPFNYNMWGVIGYDVGADARAFHPGYGAPSGNPNEYIMTGVDNTGDGVEDLIVTSYVCADTEPPGTSGSMATAPACMDTFVRDGPQSEWERVTHDVWYQCR